MNGAAVVLNYMNEREADDVGPKVIRKRAIETCHRFKDELLAQVTRPGNPFMVVIQTWSNKPDESVNGKSPYLREIYLTKNCRVKTQRKA
jgi:hypothetical protein